MNKKELIHEIMMGKHDDKSAQSLIELMNNLDVSVKPSDFPPELSEFTNKIGTYIVQVKSPTYQLNNKTNTFVPKGFLNIFREKDEAKYKRNWKRLGRKEMSNVITKNELIYIDYISDLSNPKKKNSEFKSDDINLNIVDKIFESVSSEYELYTRPNMWPHLREKRAVKLERDTDYKPFTPLKVLNISNKIIQLRPMKRTVVQVPTKEEFVTLMRIYESAGWKWMTRDLPTKSDGVWNIHKKQTCVITKNKFTYSPKLFHRVLFQKIISLDEFYKFQGIKKQQLDMINKLYEVKNE